MKSVPLHPIRIFLCGCMEYFGEIGLPCFISTMIEDLCLPTVHGIRIQRVRSTLVAHLKNMNSLVYLSPMYFNSVNKASTWISLNSPHLMSDSGFFFLIARANRHYKALLNSTAAQICNWTSICSTTEVTFNLRLFFSKYRSEENYFSST